MIKDQQLKWEGNEGSDASNGSEPELRANKAPKTKKITFLLNISATEYKNGIITSLIFIKVN